MDGRIDMTKQRGVLCDYANLPEKEAEMRSLKPQDAYYNIRILKYKNVRSMTLIMQGEGINIYKMK